jgi:galactokinase
MKNKLKEGFISSYKKEPTNYISCGGRFEILGNHTDHNHGMCLAATCDLAISSAISINDDLIVRLVSEGNPSFEIDLSNLEVLENEKFTSQGLIRGVANYLNERGYKIGGFNVYMTSTIFSGAGVSSSAAFELLIAQIFNELFNNNSIDKMVLCKAGQYAENKYFGKKSGLLDQIGVAYGGIVYIDFVDIVNPHVEPMVLPFKDLHFVIVNTGGSHADLSDAYSAIPLNMYEAANKMGHDFLIEGSLNELENIKNELSDIQYTRAIHFYNENIRVKTAKEAVLNNDEETFLRMINESRISSTKYLKNMMVENDYVGSPLEACDLIVDIIKDNGAVKINGGGFAGSVICVVKEVCFNELINAMSAKYGKQNVKEVLIRPCGPNKF